ncbi:amidohydrolase/deacetylase family metallohydrolase [Anderseniella sp. Alg231-50]|uniref:amidohydrolase/deacetylase family metallohydrolase n=1 Tax=Anderseniella sp. Alg231-50 TaxID=1922226 RepID=UPI00307B10F3
MAMYDLVLKGGHVVDPAQAIDGPMDVAFRSGKVAAVQRDIDVPAGVETRDVSGHYVTPGLIDMHTHVYWGGTSLGIDAEEYCRTSAVTTAIDTGSTGPGNFAGFRKHVIEKSDVRVLAYLHISHAGIFGFSNRIMVGESEELRLMDPQTAVEVALANRDLIVGIKIRLGKWASGIHGMAPFEHSIQVAEETGLPMMVHIDEPPPSYGEVVERLRPHDVLTHCFRPFPNTPVTPDGKVRPEVLAARQRGVLFDVGHGMGSFSFKVARMMLDNGFYPDTISSDVHALCINGPAFDQVTTLSKFLNLGMSFPEVIRTTTENAARALSRPDLGNLKPGSIGDAAILSVDDGRFNYVDVTGETLAGDKKVNVHGVVLAGKWWHPN